MAKRERQQLEVPLFPEGWFDLVDLVARGLGSGDRRGAALAREVEALSRVYSRRGGQLQREPTTAGALAARLRFFLSRDMLKFDAALSAMEAQGVLPAGPRWRVLDLGSGVGASSLGVIRWLTGRGVGSLDITALDRDPRALGLYTALVQGQAALEGGLQVDRLETRQASILDLSLPAGSEAGYDLVIVGLALNELLEAVSPTRRIEVGLTQLSGWLRALSPRGVLLVLEPALRTQARQLQQIRDALVASATGPRVLAPCLGSATCPMLQRERDWCHARAPLSLPRPLAEVARGAGLRWEGLTYSYLALTHPEEQSARSSAGWWRLLSRALRSKGKTEWIACGAQGQARLVLLDRHRGKHHAALERLGQGDLVHLEGASAEAGLLRIRQETGVTVPG